MKKLLAILLTLILCFGVLVSCDTPDESSSSEEESKDAQGLSFFNYAQPEISTFATFYRKNGQFTDGYPSDNEAPLKDEWKAINTYEEFVLAAPNLEIDSSIFEDNFVLEWACSYMFEQDALPLSFSDFKLENGTAHISYYTSFVVPSSGRAPSSSGTSPITKRYIIVPRSRAGDNEISSIEEIVATGIRTTFYPYDFKEASNCDYKDFSTWLIKDEISWNEFNEFHNLQYSLDFEECYYVVVYREKSNDFSSIGYRIPDTNTPEGEELTLDFIREANPDSDGEAVKGFDIIKVRKSSTFNLDEKSIVSINVKNVLYEE